MRTHLGLLLHMHQPLYVDPLTGRAEMPWVRLHAGRGYLDVAEVLARHPAIGLTVNFVPSLVEQLELCAAGKVVDGYEALARQGSWSEEERSFLLGRFFSVHWGRSLEGRPRYRELLDKRGRKVQPEQLGERARAFSDGELRDLTVLFHLAWLGFAIRRRDPHARVLAELEKKGRGYDAGDLEAVLEAGRAACRAVLPAWRALAAAGKVELSASPYYHPIVPLLVDSDAARRAMPSAALPERFAFAADAREQIALGRDAHAKAFGGAPRGMWPPEGSVSPEAVACYRDEKIGWLATDEGNLFRSLGDGARGALYRPWRWDGVDLVFRDRDLSDRIGFSYAFGDPAAGARDLLGRVRAAGAQAASGSEPPLVTVALDGENPWEAYQGSGEPFLEALFDGIERADDLAACSIGDHLEAHPSRGALPRLHSGSWIDSDFHIWIGDPVKNRGWELLGEARRRLAKAEAEGLDGAKRDAARRHLLAAEGSDWFWWFGEPFNSAEDPLFDRLFRSHLQAAWSALGDTPPRVLERPVDGGYAAQAVHAPRGLIRPTIDGRVSSYFEWIDAGRYEVPRGAAMAEGPLVSALHFGCNGEALFLRLDPADGAGARLAALTVEVDVVAGGAERALVADPGASGFVVARAGGAPGAVELAVAGRIARGGIVEIELPFAALGAGPGTGLELAVRLREGEVVIARLPRDETIAIAVPDRSFAADHWSV
jgi:alpha-amylase/alpha-mannosidase (GH57 family)